MACLAACLAAAAYLTAGRHVMVVVALQAAVEQVAGCQTYWQVVHAVDCDWLKMIQSQLQTKQSGKSSGGSGHLVALVAARQEADPPARDEATSSPPQCQVLRRGRTNVAAEALVPPQAAADHQSLLAAAFPPVVSHPSC